MVWKQISEAASNFGKGTSSFGKTPERQPSMPSRVEDIFGKFYGLIAIGSLFIFAERYLISHIHFMNISPYRGKIFFAGMGAFLIFTLNSLRKDFAILYRYSVRRSRKVGAALLGTAGSIWIFVFFLFLFIIRKYTIDEIFDIADPRVLELCFLLVCFSILSVIIIFCLIVAKHRGIKID